MDPKLAPTVRQIYGDSRVEYVELSGVQKGLSVKLISTLPWALCTSQIPLREHTLASWVIKVTTHSYQSSEQIPRTPSPPFFLAISLTLNLKLSLILTSGPLTFGF